MQERYEAMQSDANLIARIRERDPEALVEAYAVYGKRVFSLIYRITQDRSAAEEILQDTFLRLWSRVPAFDEEIGSLLPWLFCVGRNCALDYLRKESRRGGFDVMFTEEWLDGESQQPDGSIPVLGFDSHLEEQDGVRSALSALPEEQRSLIEMAYFEGWTHSELAEQTGESLGTVKSRIRLGLKRLRTILSGRRSEISQ